MRGIILLDGPDCAGKTTLARGLQNALTKINPGYESVIIHQTKPKTGKAWEEHSEAMLTFIEQAYENNKLVIVDRHFLSESIYGNVYRNLSEYPLTARWMDMILYRFRSLRVICCPPAEVVKQTHAEMKQVRFEMYEDRMDQVANAFLGLWENDISHSSLPTKDYVKQLSTLGGVKDKAGWYHYDYTKETSVEKYADFLLQELVEEASIAPDMSFDVNTHAYTGFPHKRAILLVGDKSVTASNKFNIPFFSNHNSSLHLATALHMCCVDASQLVIANINDKNGIETVGRLSELCGKTFVLGREAERTMLQQNIEFDGFIRHPENARRASYSLASYSIEMSQLFQGQAGAYELNLYGKLAINEAK